MTPRVALIAAIAAISLTMAGCYGDGFSRSEGDGVVRMRVAVRDAETDEPLAGVVVLAEVPARDHPTTLATLLGRTGPEADRAMTDERGEVVVGALSGRAVRLGLLRAGQEPLMVLLDPNPADGAAADWLLVSATGRADRSVEVRIVAAETPGITSR